MTLYDDTQKIAQSLLKDFRQGTISLVEIVPGSGPSNNPGPATRVPHAVDGVARGVSWKYVQAGLALTSDKQVIIPAGGIVPKVGWKLIVDGVEYSVVVVEPRPGAGTASVYIVVGKK